MSEYDAQKDAHDSYFLAIEDKRKRGSMGCWEKPKRKFRNVPTEVDGIKFASKREARRYSELKMLERANAIRELQLQPRYPLVVNGLHVCTYVADFVYFDLKTGRFVTEDVKGVKTRDFINKAKLFHAIYGREVVLI